jgi:hypothetical protein
MKKWYPRVAGAAVLIVALGLVLLIRVKTAKGSPQDIFSGDSGCISYVPEEWGQFIGSSALTGIGFEDKNGTLRFVTSLPCGTAPGVALEVRRTRTKAMTGPSGQQVNAAPTTTGR